MQKYLIIILLFAGCATMPAPALEPILHPQCRHDVAANMLFLQEHWQKVQISVDPTIAKHAQCRYFDGATWHWYPSEIPAEIRDIFNPVFFFDEVESYIPWYKAIYHNKRR